VDVLLNLGADIETRQGDGRTPLMAAAFNGRADVVKVLLRRGAQVEAVASTDSGELNALLGAAIDGHDDVVQALTESGARVDAVLRNQPAIVDLARVAGHDLTVAILEAAAPAPRPRDKPDDPSDTPSRIRANWLVMYERLREYRGVHGHADVPTQWPEDPKLAVWVSNQRQRRKKNSAAEEEIALLDRLDFTWAMRERGSWEDRLQELIDFESAHGHFDVPTDYPIAPKLKQFIASSRYQNRRGELSPERQHKLNEIGFPWGAIEPAQAAAGDMSQATDALPEARAPLSYSALAAVVLAGKTVAITGRFEQLSQSEAQALVEGLGARVVDKMSGQVDVLFAGYDVGTKFADATDRGVLILGELDLLHLAKPDRPEYI
jgi:hypothetical protein